MRKLFLFAVCLGLTACVEPRFYPYEGDKTIKGDGGFYEGYISVDSMGSAFFGDKPEYKYDLIDIYASGLPYGETCTLIGYVASSNHSDIEKMTFELGGNVLSRSDVSMPIPFKDGIGVLNVGMGAGVETSTSWTSFGSVTNTTYRYNIFECK